MPVNQKPVAAVPVALLPHVQAICDFVALFPDGKMEHELWQFIFECIKDTDEDALPEVLRVNAAQLFALLQKVCRAMQAIADEWSD